MKKSILIAISLVIGTHAFCSELYMNYFSSYDEKCDSIWKSALESAKKESAKIGVKIIETNNSVPTDYIDFSSYSDMSDEELEKAAIEYDENEKAEYERFSKMFSSVEIYGSKSNPYREELKSRKKKLDNETSFKYPYVAVENLCFDTFYSYGFKDNSGIKLEAKYYSSKNDYISLEFVFPVSDLNTNEIQKCIMSFSYFADSSSQSKLKKDIPIHLDTIDFSKYVGKETESQNLYYSKVVALDDYSMIVRDGDRVAVFDAAGTFKSDLTDKIYASIKNSESMKSLAPYWIPTSRDGKEIQLLNPKTNKSFVFSDDLSLKGTVTYNYPSQSLFLFGITNEGRPYFSDNYGKTFFFAGKDGSSVEKLDFDTMGHQKAQFSKNGKIWNKHNAENYIKIYDKNGKLDRILIFTDSMGEFFYANEDFFLTTIVNGEGKIELSCRDLYGKKIYSTILPDYAFNSVVTDYKNGIFYLMNVSNGLVTRLVEPNANIPQFMKSIIAIKKEREKNPKNPEFTKKIAECYRNAGGNYIFYSLINQYLEKCPGDPAALDKKIIAEVQLQKTSAHDLSEKTLELFDEYGIETARESYQNAMKTLERLKRLAPNDAEILSMYSELKSVFEPEKSVSSSIPSLKIESVEISPIFPAKLNLYASKPNGIFYVSNPTKKTLKNVTISTFVRKYMDFASKTEVLSELKPGASDVPVYFLTPVNSSVLSLNEDMNVQMQFIVSWEEDEKQNSITMNRPVTIYKRSAMDWGDLPMISCFVMPNDESISSFVFDNMNSKNEIVKTVTKNIEKAMLISNALGSIPLNYVSDPVTPATDQIGNRYAIDTVRFPAETLAKKGGDCDDMTTLFCSLLESAGVPCAVITTPEHIFAAFDSGLKKSSVWDKFDLSGELRFVPKEFANDDTLWIPVETTIFSSGFYEAWKKASSTIYEKNLSKSAASTIEEFVVLSNVKSDYPPVSEIIPLAKVKSQKNIASQLDKSSSSAINSLFTESLSSSATFSNNAVELNKISRFLYSMGDSSKALEVLTKATKIDANYRAGFMNMASIYKSQNDMDNYKKFVSKAESVGKGKKNTAEIATVGDSVTRADDSNGFVWEE